MHEFALEDEDVAAVAEVCRRLDGLPLAIELAAAHVPHLSLPALAERLERRLPLLTGGARDLPARLQTMRQAIAWSHDLLDAAEGVLFRRLAVFAGGFTLEAASALADGGESVFDTIASLVDKSLLRRMDGTDGEPRYMMLETIRQFALEQLDASNETGNIRHRHAAWCLVMAEGSWQRFWAESHDARAITELAADDANLRAALAWTLGSEPDVALRLAGALSVYWYHRGQFEEGRMWVERALAVASPDSAEDALARVTLATGFFADLLQDDARAASLLDEGLARYRRLGDTWGIAHAQYFRAGFALRRGDLPLATTRFEEALAAFAASGDLAAEAMTLAPLARIAYQAGDMERAVSRVEAALLAA
jgi:predicted ATPase